VGLIHYESWDGVVAPAIPAGWTVASPAVTTATLLGGNVPVTAPNVLKVSSGGATHCPATFGTADNAGGNVLVQADFVGTPTASAQTVGLFARGSANPIVLSSSTYYWVTLSAANEQLILYKVISGTATALATVSTGAGLSGDEWYSVQFSAEANVLAVTVTDLGSGNTLNASGNFVSGPLQIAIAITDASISGSGYSGITLQATSSSVYSDEFYLYGLGNTPPQKPPLQSPPILQRARGRGRVLQPIRPCWNTGQFPPPSLHSGIIWRDCSPERRSIDHGWIYQPVPARLGVPPSLPFAYWQTIKWLDTSELRRRIAAGKAATPRSLPPVPVPASIPFAFWRTIRWSDPSESIRRRNAGRVYCPGAVVIPGGYVNEGFTQQYITSVNPPVQYGTELFLSWTSDAPPGLVFQVYENDQLVWHGSSTYVTLPLAQYLVQFAVGTVGAGQAGTSFGYELPPAPLLQAQLSWLGGTFEAPDIQGFYLYGEASPGAGINYSIPLATIPAYTQGIVTDGFGTGGFGEGGFGEAAGSYSWISPALSSGTWHFAVVPFDTIGNQGTGATTAVVIVAPPGEPAPFPDRTRLHYVYNSTTHVVTLGWNASPG